MSFSMKVSNEKLEGQDVVPSGEYNLKLLGFKPKVSKKGDSFNYNPYFEITGHPEFAGRKIYDTWNSVADWLLADYSHALGLPLETDGTSSWLPGSWDGDKSKFREDDPSTWVYVGPLVGRTAKVELTVDNYQGKDNNKVRRYFCAVPDCAQKFPKIKHSTDLTRKA